LWIIIFPEGTRVVAGETRKFGVSGALLATETGKLIVPLSHNAGEFWVRRGIVKKPGTVRVVIGAPIQAAGRNPRAVNEEIRQAIDAGLKRIAGIAVDSAA
jgi:1-acyl-sn-glycerol-3-phosphate acyltransferase